jgi:predicted TIM-barrel fold metal-dependent hydrolase
MKGKIGLEEHFAIDDTLNDSKGFFPDVIWQEVRERILDLHGRRLRLMDEFGMQMMILSLNAPAVQAIHDPKKADEVARKANDYLAEQVKKRPDRFQALAALPLQDPDLAARELERCVKQLGMVGALANGFSQIGDPNTIAYLDEKQYWPFWDVCNALDVPFYLHPRNPLPQDSRIYKDHGWLMGPIWAFGHETAVHALRLMGSGLFDKYPKLQIILGHMGEGLPFNIWRVDNANAWIPNRNTYPAKKKIAEYFQANFHITVSGNFCTPSLLNALMVNGADRIMFSTDWPFENIDHAALWFDAVNTISEEDRYKIGRGNALKLFKLKG